MINLPVRLTGALNVVTCGVPNTATRGTKARINTTYIVIFLSMATNSTTSSVDGINLNNRYYPIS